MVFTKIARTIFYNHNIYLKLFNFGPDCQFSIVYFSFLVALYLPFPFCMHRSNTASPEEAGQSGSEDLHPWVRRFERGPADWSRGGKRSVAAALGAVRTGAEWEPAL